MSTTACPPARHVSDEQLILRVRSGDQEAFEQLYERYVGRVYCFVETRLNNRADVEETTQEVFVNVFTSLGSFRAEAPFAAWVLGVARHTIAGRFKKDGDKCEWAPGDHGPDQCRPAKGRFKKTGDKCEWSATDSGPNQCDPRQVK